MADTVIFLPTYVTTAYRKGVPIQVNDGTLSDYGLVRGKLILAGMAYEILDAETREVVDTMLAVKWNCGGCGKRSFDYVYGEREWTVTCIHCGHKESSILSANFLSVEWPNGEAKSKPQPQPKPAKEPKQKTAKLPDANDKEKSPYTLPTYDGPFNMAVVYPEALKLIEVLCQDYGVAAPVVRGKGRASYCQIRWGGDTPDCKITMSERSMRSAYERGFVEYKTVDKYTLMGRKPTGMLGVLMIAVHEFTHALDASLNGRSVVKGDWHGSRFAILESQIMRKYLGL